MGFDKTVNPDGRAKNGGELKKLERECQTAKK